MALKNQPLTISYLAWNTSTNQGETGDAANHTLRAVGDGAEFTPGESPHEADSTNLKGVYTLALQAAEMNYNFITVGGVSSTSNVVILPISVVTERGVLPAAAPATAGGLIVIGTGAGEIEPDGTGKVTYANAAPPSPSAIATALWEDLTGGGDFATAGSIGLLLVNNVNATIGSRLATSGYIAPDNADIATILADITALIATVGIAGAGLSAVPGVSDPYLAARLYGAVTAQDTAGNQVFYSPPNAADGGGVAKVRFGPTNPRGGRTVTLLP